MNGSASRSSARTGFRRGFRSDPLLTRLVSDHRPRDGRLLDRARPRFDRAGADGRHADARGRRGPRPVGLPRGRHARRREVRRAPLREESPGMSYTLRGRIESRLAALLPVLAGACAVAALTHRWWPLELAALMAAVGLALDAQVYHRAARLPARLVRAATRAARARRADSARARDRHRRSVVARR